MITGISDFDPISRKRARPSASPTRAKGRKARARAEPQVEYDQIRPAACQQSRNLFAFGGSDRTDVVILQIARDQMTHRAVIFDDKADRSLFVSIAACRWLRKQSKFLVELVVRVGLLAIGPFTHEYLRRPRRPYRTSTCALQHTFEREMYELLHMTGEVLADSEAE